MLRFGNPYTRDSSAAARNAKAAAKAIAAGGRSGGVANENGNRDMSHRVVMAVAAATACGSDTRIPVTNPPCRLPDE